MKNPIRIKYEEKYVQIEFIVTEDSDRGDLYDTIFVKKIPYDEFKIMAKEFRLNINEYFEKYNK